MTTEQAIQDVAMIARNGIDRCIELERENARLREELSALRPAFRGYFKQGQNQQGAGRPVAQRIFDDAFNKPGDTRSAEYKQGVPDILRHRFCEPNPEFKVGRYSPGTPQADVCFAGCDEGDQLAGEYLQGRA